MGNGEQYIWKPPEDDDIITLHAPPHRGENGHGHPSPPTAKEVVCVRLCTCIYVVAAGEKKKHTHTRKKLQAPGKSPCTDRLPGLW